MGFSKTHMQKFAVRNESLKLTSAYMSCNFYFRTMSADTKRKSHLHWFL